MNALDVETDRSDTLLDALRVLRRRWMVVAGCIALCTLAALVLHTRKDPTYEATTNVAFGIADLSDNARQVAQNTHHPERDAATNVLIAKSPAVAQAVVDQLRLGIDAHDLADQIQV